jgi:hypothetical protein
MCSALCWKPEKCDLHDASRPAKLIQSSVWLLMEMTLKGITYRYNNVMTEVHF